MAFVFFAGDRISQQRLSKEAKERLSTKSCRGSLEAQIKFIGKREREREREGDWCTGMQAVERLLNLCSREGVKGQYWHTSFTNFLIPVNVITVLFLNNFDGSRTQYNICWRLVVKHKVSLIFFNVYLLPCNHTLNVFLGPAINTLQLSPDGLTGECIHT